MTDAKYDVIVIGGGPGGYAAAIRAGQLGLRTLLVEKGELGGTCLNVGCIPTKFFVHFTDLLAKIKQAPQLGINVTLENIDLHVFQQKKKALIGKLKSGVSSLLKSNQVHFINGIGSFDSDHFIRIKTQEGEMKVQGDNIILAVGTRPRELKHLPFDGETVVSSDHVLSWTSVPSTLAIVGAGVVGMEFASIFSKLGVKVSVIEILPRILPLEDAEMAAQLLKALEKRGVHFFTQTAVTSLVHTDGKVELALDQLGDKKRLIVDKVLVAAGRTANLASLHLEKSGVVAQGGFITVNEQMETNVPGVFAVGDIVPGWQLAHVAFEEGAVAAENAAGHPKKMSYSAIPRCIFTEPELSSVGLNEEQARAQYDTIQTFTFPFSANSKAMMSEKGEGMVKIIIESKYQEIVGLSFVGEGVNELIAEGTLAMRLESTVTELAEVIHPHPSLSEIVKEVALLAMGKPLHMKGL